eukprot:gene11895-5301_t
MSKTNAQKHVLKYSRKRILKDYLDIQKNPLETVRAEPLQDNHKSFIKFLKKVYEWHGNFKGLEKSKYKGIIFHIIIRLASDYPVSPPKVELCTTLEHKHVHQNGKWICLDMLENWSGFENSNNLPQGWTSGYSIQSILIQLQSFLMNEEDLPSDSDSYKVSESSFKKFKCQKCGHSADKPFPSFNNLNEENKNENHPLKNVFSNIFEYLDLKNIQTISNTCHLFKNISKNEIFEKRRNICCFHTKMNYEEAVLGYPIEIKNDVYSSSLDIISYFAFKKEGIRKTMFKEDFKYWIPIYINKKHGKATIPYLKDSIEMIYNTKFKPKLALDLLTKLMNSMIVLVMNGTKHASIKALDGYISFHRLLIALIEEFPQLLDIIESKIKLFLNDPYSRRKIETPSIGEFLPLLTVSESFTWKDISIPVLQETLARNYLWVKKNSGNNYNISYPNLKDKLTIQTERISLFFQHSKVSLSLLNFHVYFLKNFAPRKDLNLKEISNIYDLNYGFTNDELKLKFQNEVNEIKNMKDYKTFFEKCYINFSKVVSDNTSNSVNSVIDQILIDSYQRSHAYGYHKKYDEMEHNKQQRRLKGMIVKE